MFRKFAFYTIVKAINDVAEWQASELRLRDEVGRRYDAYDSITSASRRMKEASMRVNDELNDSRIDSP